MLESGQVGRVHQRSEQAERMDKMGPENVQQLMTKAEEHGGRQFRHG